MDNALEEQQMRLLCGAVFLVGAEQAYAHSLLIAFPNQEAAARVLIPASITFAVLGTIMVVWGLFSEIKAGRKGHSEA